MRSFALTGILAAAVSTVWGAATVTGVVDNNGLLTVSYALTEKAVITFDATTNGVPIEAKCFRCAEGDVFKLIPAGAGQFVWRPANDIPGFNISGADLKVRVKAWSVDAPPDYMVVNLATNATTAVSVNYYECEAQLPGKVTDPVYKTAKLVMRKIPAANVTWRMGSPTGETGRADNETTHLVTLTEDYYLGVYPYTNGQGAWVNSNPNNIHSMTAAGINTYADARGMTKRWPGDGHVLADSDDKPLQRLRRYTGIDFDLPTEAQWEFACRAAEKAALYTGKNLSGTTACDEADEVAWYANNSTSSQWMGYKEVGLKKPNAFGLYDMLGNCYEFCLDRWGSYPTGAETDPKGSASGDNIVKRGGALDSTASKCRSAARSWAGVWAWADVWTGNRNTGIRLWAPAKAVK